MNIKKVQYVITNKNGKFFNFDSASGGYPVFLDDFAQCEKFDDLDSAHEFLQSEYCTLQFISEFKCAEIKKFTCSVQDLPKDKNPFIKESITLLFVNGKENKLIAKDNFGKIYLPDKNGNIHKPGLYKCTGIKNKGKYSFVINGKAIHTIQPTAESCFNIIKQNSRIKQIGDSIIIFGNTNSLTYYGEDHQLHVATCCNDRIYDQSNFKNYAITDLNTIYKIIYSMARCSDPTNTTSFLVHEVIKRSWCIDNIKKLKTLLSTKSLSSIIAYYDKIVTFRFEDNSVIAALLVPVQVLNDSSYDLIKPALDDKAIEKLSISSIMGEYMINVDAY